MNSLRSRFTMTPILVAVLAVAATFFFVGTVGAQTGTTPTQGGINGTLPPSGTTGGQTTPNSMTPDDLFAQFEQMMVTGLREMLTQQFPGSDQMDINFLADLVFHFFMEQFFFGNQHMGMGTNAQ
jgi:hypothetical protein